MKLVELIPALQTDSSVLDVARGFAERMGKTVTLSADTPGASSSRLRLDSRPSTELTLCAYRLHLEPTAHGASCRQLGDIERVGSPSLRLPPSQPFINEAIITLETGIASKEDIDTTLKLGMAHPMGPLQLADLCAAPPLSPLRSRGPC